MNQPTSEGDEEIDEAQATVSIPHNLLATFEAEKKSHGHLGQGNRNMKSSATTKLQASR